MSKILIVDDDTSFGLMIEGFLNRKGYDTFYASSFSKASDILSSQKIDLLLTDYRLDTSVTGLDLISLAKKHNKNTVVVLVTAYSDIRVAVNAIKLGAFEYIAKPINPEELQHVIKKGLAKNTNAEKQTKPVFDKDYIKGISKYSLDVEKQIDLISPTDLSVIILGESGVGKEYIAQQIHERSNRSNEPFVAVDCGALQTDLAGSELFGHKKGSFTGALEDKIGHFENVKNGTVFLDEIGNLSYDVQIKLLRAIQERKARKIGGNDEYPINCRFIAATNDDLRNSSFSGKFREDLYHRLNEFSIHILPLNKRKDDVLFYGTKFLEMASIEFSKLDISFSNDVKDLFVKYDWPGNLRELRNVIRRATLLTQNKEITLTELPIEIQNSINNNIVTTPKDLKEAKEKSEKEIILETLEKTKYNKAKTARILGIDRKTLYNKIAKYNIDL